MARQYEVVTILNKISDLIGLRQQQLQKLDELVKARFVEMFGEPMVNPMRWPIHQLSQYIKFLTSGSRGWAQYFTDEGEYFITIKNVKNCHISLKEVQHIKPPDNAEAKRTRVQEGDLLISITADLGRTGVVPKTVAEHGAYINQHLTCIRLNRQLLNPLYVAYYMESNAGKIQFQSKNQSAVKAGLNFNSINSLNIMVPPMELQNQFADFVKATDKSKAVVRKALA
jgi:type I restriction enzyme S subunit